MPKLQKVSIRPIPLIGHQVVVNSTDLNNLVTRVNEQTQTINNLITALDMANTKINILEKTIQDLASAIQNL